MLARYHRQRAEKIQELGGKCVDCGSTEELEFDHIVASTKEFGIAKEWSKNREDFEKELEKCQLLCKECHSKKSREKGDYGRLARHGTYWMYRKYKCRCEPCVKANSETIQSWKAKSKRR